MFKTILVTGCGGDLGFGIGKILKKYTHRLLGCDIHNFHPGKLLFDECYNVPKATDDTYIDIISELIKQQKIDIVIPSSEHEIAVLQKNIHKIHAEIIMCDAPTFEICNDKFTTINFLKTHSLPFPETHLIEEKVAPMIPCIIKDRTGSGSKAVMFIPDIDLYNYYSKINKTSIWQEYLSGDDSEYTCGVFRSKSGVLRTIIFKRKLSGGFTNKGEVIHDPKINDLLISVANKLNLCGCINVQLRKIGDVPMIFEINPRFSSTVVFRHLLGFQDLIWSIRDKLHIELDEYIPVKQNIKFCVMPNQYIL
jgi:carbamoyl-phosphate synthase large subunit